MLRRIRQRVARWGSRSPPRDSAPPDASSLLSAERETPDGAEQDGSGAACSGDCRGGALRRARGMLKAKATAAVARLQRSAARGRADLVGVVAPEAPCSWDPPAPVSARRGRQGSEESTTSGGSLSFVPSYSSASTATGSTARGSCARSPALLPLETASARADVNIAACAAYAAANAELARELAAPQQGPRPVAATVARAPVRNVRGRPGGYGGGAGDPEAV
eukprot:TRINITY_DN4454_c0_g3_i1.p1 TRINITY_DN4454_c0_g3~~TRINITY_DN4454_c0_g3_i1.p1  ORF type:complete len:235 (+),score=23.11 TRINITY_DN4454_c0_g3_i1:40-705(+)